MPDSFGTEEVKSSQNSFKELLSGVIATSREQKAFELLPNGLDKIELGRVGRLKPEPKPSSFPVIPLVFDEVSSVKACVIKDDDSFFSEALCCLSQAFKVGFNMLSVATFFKDLVLELLSILAAR